MDWAARAAALAALLIANGAAPADAPSPDFHVRLALSYMVTAVKERDRCYTRFLSFYDARDGVDLDSDRKLLAWWVNQMSFDESAHVPERVPGSAGLMFSVDLRDYGWNSAAWAAVAARDPNFRQPPALFRSTEALRREAGYYGVKPGKDGRSPVLAIVSARWFLRETLETDRSPSYYDLLFAKRRFVRAAGAYKELAFRTFQWQDWPGGEEGGTYYAKGRYRVWTTRHRRVPDWLECESVDFPASEAELQTALGIDSVRAFARKERIDIDNGAIVRGGRDFPGEGSIVALQNRLIAVLDGPLGPYMKTFDVKRTSGVRDFSGSLLFAGLPFVRGAGARAKADGGEVLFYLPNGGQGGYLFNGDGARVEVGATTLVNDTADPHMNPGVRNAGSCVTCHASTGGFVPPDDMYKRWREAGIKFKYYSREQSNRVDGFFRGLSERMVTARGKYASLLKETSGWDGADAASAVLKFRHRYDAPVGAEQAAAELGLTTAQFKWLAVRAGIGRPNARGVTEEFNTQAQALVQGLAVPRSAFDADVKRQIALLLDAHRSDKDFDQLFDRVQVPSGR